LICFILKLTLPTRKQLALIFPNQINIASCLFVLIIETSRTQEDLENSWKSIARDIEIQDQREAL
jgi:hypothetical protein